MLDFLYSLFIGPLEALYYSLFTFFHYVTASYPLSLLLLSLSATIILQPFKHLALKAQANEQKLQAILTPQLEKIKNESSGAERQYRISSLYRRYAYHPILSLRSSFGILLQVPFLCAAYFMLSSFSGLEEQSFFLIKDLSKPDQLLVGINILPLLMTLINIAALYAAPHLQRKEHIQGLFIAFLFLILLYNAPSALLIYWTLNNLFVLVTELYGRSALSIPIPGMHGIRKFFLSYGSLSSLPLFFAFFIILPYLYFLQANWTRYSTHAIIFSLTLFGVVGLFVFCVCAGISEFFKLQKHLPRSLKKTWSIVLCALLGLVLVFIVFTFADIFLRHYVGFSVFQARLLQVGLAVGILLMWSKRYTRYINCALILTCSLICISWAQSAVGPRYEANSFSVSLNQKPNIFLFLLESFHDLEIQKNTYGIENSDLKDFLNQHDFVVYPDTFSNSCFTLASVGDIFGMQSSRKGALEKRKDGFTLLYNQIGGNDDNTVLRVLKDNGYSTCFLGGNRGGDFFYSQGKNLDITDLPIGFESLIQPIAEYNKKLSDRVKKMLPFSSPQSVWSGSIEERLGSVLQLHNYEQPLFVMYYGGAEHTPSRPPVGESTFLYSYKNFNEWINSGRYQKAAGRARGEIFTTVEMILEHDPNALIILIGDHGVWRYRLFLDDLKTVEDIEQRFNSTNISLKDYADDMFGVFLAIRTPSGQENISKGIPISHVNLFRYVFSYLNDDLQLLEELEENISHMQNFIFVKNAEYVLKAIEDE